MMPIFVSLSTLSAVVKKGLNSSLLDSLSAYINAGISETSENLSFNCSLASVPNLD